MRLICFFLLLFISCDSIKKESTTVDGIEKKYDLYEPSEMAIYMNSIFEIHEQMKTEILEGNMPEAFPIEILEIHTAHLSDFKERSSNFEAFSNLFVERVEFIFDESSNVPLKQRYNDAVNICLACHQIECTGPIPRIKKLLIN